MDMDIDFVILWVDGSDPNWLAEKRKYDKAKDDDDDEERYRDWDLLRYWFRGVEKFAPWVRKIHFVTWGHLPSWLDTANPKLHIVKHEDFIPKEILPLFNSTAIEKFIYRIDDLAEHFVYFNDDFFLINHKKKTDYFIDGKVVDLMAFQPVVANPKNPVMSSCFMNNTLLLCKHFDKRTCVKKNIKNFFHFGYPPIYFFYNFLELAFPLFTGFYTVHNPSPFRKEKMEELWNLEYEELMESSKNRFRSKGDISQYVFREWQKLSGDFVPRNILKDFAYFEVTDDNAKLLQTIRKQKKSTICINDTGKTSDVDRTIADLQSAFKVILPEQSGFEI